MILGKNEIEKLIKNKQIIEGYDPDLSKNNPAKIDLRLGKKCYVSSQESIIVELNEGKSVEIMPNDIFLYQTLEKVKMPKDIAGHLSLKMGQTARGLLMSNQTQIDPGFHNYIFGMLYNLSDKPITLSYGTPFVTLELFQINDTSTTYHGHMKNISFEEFCSTRIKSSLGMLAQELKIKTEEIARTDKKVRRSNDMLNILTFVVAVVTVAITVFSIFMTFRSDPEVVRLSEKVEYQNDKIEALEEEISRLDTYITDHESDNSSLETKITPPAGADTSKQK
ncbi:MAG: hypothetical protein PHF63_06250 [Herbinix sp.]|nr:hypothetical protein [Herbinix sp.]